MIDPVALLMPDYEARQRLSALYGWRVTGLVRRRCYPPDPDDSTMEVELARPARVNYRYSLKDPPRDETRRDETRYISNDATLQEWIECLKIWERE